MPYRHVILDRDGVLNAEPPDAGYVHRPDDFHWLAGALDALALLHRAGVRISVATNQSGIGRGLMSLGDLQRVHDRMRTEAASAGGPIDAIFFCPHAPDAHCACRKPEPGLIQAAIAASGISAEETLVVGDDERDLEAAARAGVAFALVRTGKGSGIAIGLGSRARGGARSVAVFDDLSALAHDLAGRTPGAAKRT